MKTIQKWLKLKTWHSFVPRKHKKPESPKDFLERIVRLAATRASMASWGQPFEAIASWLWLALRRDEMARKTSFQKDSPPERAPRE